MTPQPNVPLQSEARIRTALSCTWHAFFARFPHLRDVQKAAVLPVLRGESVVVNAPTASGKTEAIIAPVVERLLQKRLADRSVSPHIRDKKPPAIARGKTGPGHVDLGVGPAILIVAPTKALCNDLYRRLLKPIRTVGLEIAVRTGDSPAFNAEKPPAILVTTPESLDSLVARKPASFLYLETIVIDEIHLLHASGRGDQLRCLLARLRILNKHPVQICASSATVPEIDRIALDFMGMDAKRISCPSADRDIRAKIVKISGDPGQAVVETLRFIESLLDESPTRKLIAFCNSRSNVENIVLGLRQNPRIASIVFAHHGSLSKEERIRTEKQFLLARHAACVATSTLELGIDIGDVDQIVLLGPPPDVPSLIQRIGRGSRSMDYSRVCCLADSDFSALRFMHLVECARRETLFPDPVSFRPTTMVQQALSVCLQNPECWIGKKALYDRLPSAVRQLYSADDCGDVLESMAAGGLMRKVERGRYVPESKARFLFKRGFMHSMISDRSETDVVDAVTGRTLGSIHLGQAGKNAIRTGSGVSLTLAGNAHTVSYMRDSKLFVKRGSDNAVTGFLALEPPRYSIGLARSFAQYMHIPNDAFYVKCVPTSFDVTPEFTPKIGDLLRPEIAIDPRDVPPGSEYLVIHFTGSIGSLLLMHYFERHGHTVKKSSRSPFFMRLTTRPSLVTFPDEEKLLAQFRMYIHGNVTAFAKLLQPGPWLGLIPEEFVLRWLLGSIDLKAYARALANLPIYLV